jgi:alanyl-tRNA synthetase
MTDRLYYTDPYLREFDATIHRVAERVGRVSIELDRTAFYPTSGGQPFDTGTLGPYKVVDVFDEDDGTVWHTVAAGPPIPNPQSPIPGAEPGQSVRGAIDWPRRFDHMQQHTGQHVLSAAFERLFGVRTLSFHLGADVSTIDLARETTPAEIAKAEDAANAVVWEDRPVAIRFASAEEAAKMPLRKEPMRGGTLRLIDVEGFDLSACGGTHVARTGGIGVIAVARWERFKGGQRLEFVCGGRALRAYRSLRDATTASVRLLSVLPQDLPASIERLQADAKEQKRAMIGLQNDLARHRAGEIAASAEKVRLKPDTTDARDVRLVARAIDGDANVLKSLAAAIASEPGFIVVIVSTSSPALVVVARSADVTVASQKVLAALTAKFGGRGGGKPELAQGGGLTGTADEILAAARVITTGRTGTDGQHGKNQ